MNHLNVRCPSCAKLYQVDVSAIFSTTPHFQCVACACRFSFDFPPMDPNNVLAREVVDVLSGPASVIATRKCPRCGSESPKTAEECYSCHVIFEKLEGLPTDPSIKAQPSLVRRWKELLEDYANEDLHHQFVMACRHQDAINFARHKYEQIRQVQGQDEIADRMLERLRAFQNVHVSRALESGANQQTEMAAEAKYEAPVEPPKAKPKTGFTLATPASKHPKKEEPSWMRFALMAPFVVSFLLILWGVAHASQRNMIGTGIAVALLSYGVISSFRGPLKLKDFLR